jgi:Family of unknown function (DUF6459)
MSMSSAPEPLPDGVPPLTAVPESARSPLDARGASDRDRTARPLTLVQGGRGNNAAAGSRGQSGDGERDRSRDRDRNQIRVQARRDEPPERTERQPASARQGARRRLPSPAEVAKAIAIALFEVEAGYRSAAQLERVFAPELWDRLERQVRRHGGLLPSGRRLIRVHYQEVMPGVANTVAVVQRGTRVQPVAMRLDARSGRWLVTELRY